MLITPDEVRPTEEVTISAVVNNTGGCEGACSIVLKINDTEEARKEITLKAGESERLTFAIAKEKLGSYVVDVNGNVGQFSVVLLPPLPEQVGVLPFLPLTNWWLIGGIIAGAFLIIGLMVFVISSQRRD